MTTGSVILSGGYPAATAYQSKVWNGSDGRTEVIHGRQRVRYNNYDVRITRESPLIGSPFQLISAGASLPGGDVLLPWTSALELKLQSKLVEKIKAHDFNLAVNVAQSKQLVNMVVLNIRKFSRSLRALKRGDIATAARQLGINDRVSKLKSKDISGRWLELQYGWLPAISDTFEAAKAYEAATSMRKTRVKANGWTATTYEGSASPSNYHAPGTARTSRRVIYEMEEDISLPRSLGLEDPLSVVWEIIPYSFVIDWFLPIGTYLENLAVIPNLRGRFITTTRQTKQAAYKYGITPAYRGYRRVYFDLKVTRACTTGLSVQRPAFVESLSLALGATRIFNAVALGHQRLR
jgi:hypothetical protein